MFPLSHLLRRRPLNRTPADLSARMRDRLQDELAILEREERAHQELLQLEVRPRLSLIDEEMVVLIRGTDRGEPAPSADPDGEACPQPSR